MHKKRQRTNAGQQRCMSCKQQRPNQAAVHAFNQDSLLLWWWVLQVCLVCVCCTREGGACGVAPIPLECAFWGFLLLFALLYLFPLLHLFVTYMYNWPARSATPSSFGWAWPPGPARHHGCIVVAGPWWTPHRDRPTQTSSSAPKSAPNSLPHDLCATTFSAELGARSCQSAGVPTSLEPTYSKVAGANPSPPLVPVLQDRLLLSDASVTKFCADTYVERAEATAGSAAEVRAQKKVRKYALHGPGGYEFTPLVVESYGHQCTATHALLNKLGHLADGVQCCVMGGEGAACPHAEVG